MRILHWNCQGLRNPLTIQYLKEIRKIHSPDVMFLIETKNSNSYVHSIGEELGYANIFTLPSRGQSGGLAFFWNKDLQLSFDNPSVNYSDIYIAEGSVIFCLTYIYGHPDKRQRNGMWIEMKNMVQAGLYSHRPRIVMGDFNDIKSNEEKIGGPRRSEASFTLFREMLSVTGLHEVKTIGGQFTWVGQRHQHSIKTKIDRVFATSDWQDHFPKAYVQMLKWIGSDHRPLLLNTEDRKWKGMKLFRYDNRWRMDPEVCKVVDQAWMNDCANLPAYNFSKALIKCRNALSKWKSSINSNSQKKIQQLQQQLHKALEEEYWKAKSRVLWLQAGDKNTKFFHAKTKQRRNFNRLISIQDSEGHVHQKPDEVQKVVETYFQNLFTSNKGLIPPEVLQDKSPGADGLNAGFYRHHWNTIKQVMERMGFNIKWRSWIMKCVTSVTYSVLINGTPSAKVIPQRGIRQGDPISPYLYLICTEGLSSMLKHCSTTKQIHGYKASANGPAISHLLFADDSLLFCKATDEECQVLLNTLKTYEKASGQEINYQKSAITFSKDKNKQKIAWISWEKITASKQEGGMGIRDLRDFNIAMLAKQGTKQWNQQLINQLINESDAERIQRIRPSLTQVRDTISWIHSNNGEYSVKSGYYIQRKLSHSQAIQQYNSDVSRADITKMFKTIWRLNIPPKIKHFWWRVVHNSLPVTDTLARRNLKINQLCQLCGEQAETLNHLLFQCRVAREIWELAPLETPGDILQSQSLHQNLAYFLFHSSLNEKLGNIFPFLGWRIWKMRNDLIFNSRKLYIPHIINKAILDMKLWEEATSLPKTVGFSVQQYKMLEKAPQSIQDVLTRGKEYCCFVDASWISPDQKAGIAWSLHRKNGQQVVKGSSSVEAISSPIEAEALALLMAIQQVRNMGYQEVTFVGDSKILYQYLQYDSEANYEDVCCRHDIANYVKDILLLSRLPFRFEYVYVKRNLNSYVDSLAKLARRNSVGYIVSWNSM